MYLSKSFSFLFFFFFFVFGSKFSSLVEKMIFAKALSGVLHASLLYQFLYFIVVVNVGCVAPLFNCK